MNRHNLIKQQEIKARDKQVHTYDKNLLLPLYEKFECQELLNHLNEIPKNILEIGCGTGRFTKKLKKHNLYALDFSFLSLKKNRDNVNTKTGNNNVFYLQADAVNLPFKNSFFDIICAFQVLEHFPNKRIIVKGLKEFARVLKPRGNLFFSIYGYHYPIKIFLKKCGFHKDNIYFKRFTQKEIQQLILPYFKLIKIKRDLVGYLLAVNARKIITKKMQPYY